jgi:hypothetical protein
MHWSELRDMPKKKSAKSRPRAMSRAPEDECNFCLLPESQVDYLVRSGSDQHPANICESCVGVAAQLINDFYRERGDLGRTH